MSIDKNFIKEMLSGVSVYDGEILRGRMAEILSKLRANGQDDISSLQDAMAAVNDVLIGAKQQELYALAVKADEIAREKERKQQEIKQALRLSFEAAEDVLASSDMDDREYLLSLLSNAIMREMRLFDILGEIAQNAFLTTLERGDNTDETAHEVAKHLFKNALSDGEFSSQRAMEISRTIIFAAVEVANESQPQARELVSGSIMGVKEALSDTIERIRNDAKFAPSQSEISRQIRELKTINESFIELLKNIGASTINPSQKIIEELLDNTLDSGFAKLKRLSEQASLMLDERLNEMRQNASVESLIGQTGEQIERIKTLFSERINDINLNEKFDSIKQELSDLERKANEKFASTNATELKQKAKTLGERAYSAAKGLMGKIKDNNEK